MRIEMDEIPLPETTLRAALGELIPRHGPSLPFTGALGLGDLGPLDPVRNRPRFFQEA